MKATGIVRRVDDMGRVVIPKEVRRTLRLREGAPLEIYTGVDGELMFKKYSPLGDFNDFAKQYAEVLFKTSGFVSVICDRERVVAVSGVPKKVLLNFNISTELEENIANREKYIKPKGKYGISLVDETANYVLVSSPILAYGDVYGSVVLLAKDKDYAAGEVEMKLTDSAAMFLGKQMEI